MRNENVNEPQNQQSCQNAVSSRYKIVDKDGVEMPDHYSGRRRNYEEVKKMVDGLNKDGEYRPYKMIQV